MNAEQALMYQLQKEAEATPSLGMATGLGATGGAALGALAMSPVHAGGMMINKMRGRSNNPMKPGMRMAGGLVGAILGGALGAGARQASLQESPAARILAKIQTTGELDDYDRAALENILADTYTDMARG